MVLALRLHHITHGTEVKAFQDDLVGVNVRKDDHPVAGHYDLFNSRKVDMSALEFQINENDVNVR